MRRRSEQRPSTARAQRLIVFVPEGSREPKALPVELHDRWVEILLRLFTELFKGATAYGRGIGAWREGDDPKESPTFDRITVVETWISPVVGEPDARLTRVIDALAMMCEDLHEMEVACVLDGEFVIVRPRPGR